MSALVANYQAGEIVLVAATAKTVLQVLMPSNHRGKLLAWGVSFDATSVTAEPVVVRLLRQTTAGSGGSTVTPTKQDDSIAETIQSSGLSGMTSEPTAGDVLKRLEVHPQSGYEHTAPFGQEVIIGGSDRLGIECTAPAGVNAIPWMLIEE